MSKTYHVIAGMPYSGSSLLASLLAQNPRFHTTSPPGILSLMIAIGNEWDRYYPNACNETGKADLLRGVLRDFYRAIPRPVVFDRSPGWLGFMPLLEALVQRKAKVLVPVRDLRDILASFELIWRRSSPTLTLPQERDFLVDFQSIEGRCSIWLRKDQPVGSAYARIEDALSGGYRDRMFFVRFEELTGRPAQTMRAIYQFLGEEYFEHNFDHVEPVAWEDQVIPGVKEPRDRGPKVQPVAPLYPHVLGAAADRFKGVYVWDQPQWR